MNYKNTLNLPQTDFPMQAQLIKLEPKILSQWEDLKLYHRLRQARKGREKFILHDGPPYANGDIHIGHALNKILKDIVLKYKLMSGFDSPFIAGWDCHGLPVEHQLFKELKMTKHDVDVADFRKKAGDFALKFVDLQKNDFKRLGVLSEWDNPYLTIKPIYEHSVLKLLGYLVKDGYIYRGRKPVNWCSKCETALAEAEIEYSDKTSESIYLLFPIKNISSAAGGSLKKNVNNEFKQQNAYFLVWTTTPWTLVSNVAVAVHPELDYCLAEFSGRYVIFAKPLLPILEEKFKTKFTVLEVHKGKELENSALNHPFLNRESPVVLADFVSREEGSGCVHIAPGHGEEDFSLLRKYTLPIIMPINDKGEFVEPALFKGKNIESANKYIIDILKNNNLLINHSQISHSYPHCWRCKSPIIFRATYQWFLNVGHNNLREKLLNEIEKVKWFPPSGKERMKAMVETRPDWCLSRQRLWGIPIPAVKCNVCGKVILDENIIDKTADIFKEKGSDSWFILPPEEFLPKDFKCSSCGSNIFQKENDILDVWFESGASFYAVGEEYKELSFPADMYLEGSDQHRGWFQVSLISSAAKCEHAPYKIILTHGFVVDGEGRKMSKSLGNVISPQEIINRYGADILRLWAAYSDYGEDVKISEEILKQLVDIYRKVRNTIRFILGNIYDFDFDRDKVHYEDMREVDRYILSKTMKFYRETVFHYDEFSFYKVCQKIFNFCNLDLSAFYLDILKDRLYTFSPKSIERRAAQSALYGILKVLLKLSAPIFSFTAEEGYSAWKNIKGKEESVFLSFLNDEYVPELIDNEVIARWGKLLSLRSEVLKEIEKQRNRGVIGSSLEASVLVKCQGEDMGLYKKFEDSLREIFVVSTVSIQEGPFEINVEKAGGNKCGRCWNWNEDVGKDGHTDVCGRCARVLLSIGATK